MEGRIAGDAGVRNDDFDGAEFVLDLCNTCLGLFVVRNIPLVGLDARFIGKFRCGIVVARIGGRDGIAFVFQLFGDGGADSTAASGYKCDTGHLVSSGNYVSNCAQKSQFSFLYLGLGSRAAYGNTEAAAA